MDVSQIYSSTASSIVTEEPFGWSVRCQCSMVDTRVGHRAHSTEPAASYKCSSTKYSYKQVPSFSLNFTVICFDEHDVKLVNRECMS